MLGPCLGNKHNIFGGYQKLIEIKLQGGPPSYKLFF